jgi:AraC-like DNA-binding protein
MALTFSLSDWDELWQNAPQTYCADLVLDDFETLCLIPTGLGRGYTRSMELCPGLSLELFDQTYHQDWLVRHPVHDHLVQCHIYLLGYATHADMHPTLDRHRSYFSGSGISPAVTVQYPRSQRLVGIDIHLQPEVFAEFFTGMEGANEALVKVLLKSNDWKVAFFPRVTSADQQIVQQILDAPFQRSMRRLYLQAKVLELLTLQLQSLLEDQRLRAPIAKRKLEIIARIYHAKEVLDSQLESPPALLELARFVGVSDRTLQRGFREVFGTTVVGYLIQQRMKQAERLLREKNYTVAEVANRVGYSHLGHFAAGFKRQFGITPSECLAGQRAVS